ncbi:GH116 family glycosyl hydrolase [Parapedobacter soli]|uniref:GH116 family glycosyl hydrolase n=1 Tax=Parapedobacter soli TaxID=416955 RepID=UPI0021C8297D|nr:GH116 family glycosyl hydrolase [Parapedobacter soli]
MSKKNVQIDTYSRRTFLKTTGMFSASLLMAKFPVWGRSIFASSYPIHNIPTDKNLDPRWLESIMQPGNPVIYAKSRNELQYIGMPIGGFHAGTVYLGGDGRLWLWQIYNETIEGAHEGIDPKTVLWNDGTTLRRVRPRDGAAYIEPTIADNRRVLEQGFALRIEDGGEEMIKRLDANDWDEVTFESAYPTATIRYQSDSAPVEVVLTAYSPFIPLNAEDSALPVTIFRMKVINKSLKKLRVSVLGWLENGVNKLSSNPRPGNHGTSQREEPLGKGMLRNRATTGVDHTALLYTCEGADEALRDATDAGSMFLMAHAPAAEPLAGIRPWPVNNELFGLPKAETASAETPTVLVGGIRAGGAVEADGTFEVDFSLGWHFNNPHPKLKEIVPDAKAGYHYATRFDDALAVGNYVSTHFDRLTSDTERWRDTWLDSTLPRWFLERTLLNIGTLATANTYRFASGRFWGWEGVGACAGTCTHVWQYAQAVARLFPELERDLRERVDLGIAFKEDGAVIFRAENETRPAIDGQAAIILRCYREHQLCTDSEFLHRNWPNIRKAMEFIFAQDKNNDGMTDTPMENTLDAVWEGEIAWIVGLCIAAARAGQAMAEEVGDEKFAARCAQYVASGRKNMENELFNGEYFIHRPDPVTGRSKLGSYNTCHIDQVYGQAWMFQVGLPRVLDKDKTLSALKALWKYNFTPDVGPYIKTHLGGRPYAVAGDGGMVMNTNPLNEEKPFGDNVTWQMGYFHECMSGFEHQVAAHMMGEGMVEESMALTRMIHDRYHATKRNPYNEIECSDHYARAMASYGTFINACGFSYHGPKGYMAFAPKVRQSDFKAAFTAAAGWGSYERQRHADSEQHAVVVRHGSLQLTQLRLSVGRLASAANVALNGVAVRVQSEVEGNEVLLTFASPIALKEDDSLTVKFT